MALVCGIVMLTYGLTVAADQSNVKQTFDQLFSDRISRVTATPNRDDDIQLAQEMLDITESSPAELAILLCNESYNLASRTPDGYETALSAMRQLITVVPEQQTDAEKRIMVLLQRQFATARGDQRSQAGEQLIDELTAAATRRAKNGEMSEAATYLRRALATANQINSPRVTEVRDQLDNVTRRQSIQRMIEDYKQRLKNDPDDARAAHALLTTYLVKLDNPAEARKYSFLSKDAQFNKLISLACTDIASLTDDQKVLLGDWYVDLSSDADDAESVVTTLQHAKAYYDAYLAGQDQADLQTVKVRVAAERVQKRLESLASTSSGSPRAGAWIDLLSGLDPSKASIAGKWTLENGRLQSLRGDSTRILLRTKMPANYELSIKFARTRGDRAMFMNLPVANTSAAFIIGDDSRKSLVGLNTIDGKQYSESPVSQVIPPLKDNEPYILNLKVSTAGANASISAELNGKRIFSWQGAMASLKSPFNDEKSNGHLVLGSHYTEYMFAELKLRY